MLKLMADSIGFILYTDMHLSQMPFDGSKYICFICIDSSHGQSDSSILSMCSDSNSKTFWAQNAYACMTSNWKLCYAS